MANTLIWELRRALGSSVIAPPPPPITDAPVRIPHGLAARSYSMWAGGARPYTSTMIASDRTWADFQPVGSGALSSSAMTGLIAELDAAYAARGLTGKPVLSMLRIDAGWGSPQWAKTATGGPVTYYGRDGTDPSWPSAPSNPDFKQLLGPNPGVINYLHPSFLGLRQAFWTLMMRPLNRAAPASGGVGDHPAVCGLTVSEPMTQFNEPTVMQFACAENREAMLALGWTTTTHDAVFDGAFTMLNTLTAPLGWLVDCSYNKAEEAVPGTPTRFKTDPARTVRLMEDQVAKLGRRAMWSNHGWEGGQTDAVYQRMWAGRNGTPPVPLSFQTRTLGKLARDYTGGNLKSTVQATIQEAADRGASWVEIPSGCWSETGVQKLTLAYAQQITPVFLANNTGSSLPTVAAAPKVGWVEDGAYADNGTQPTSTLRMPSAAFIDAGMRHVVLNVGIKELITTTSGGAVSYVTGSLEQRLSNVAAWNTANPSKPLTAHVRLHVGVRAPDVWRTICGSVVINNDTFGSGGAIPIWWNPQYKDLYAKMWAVLAPVIDALPYVGSVNQPCHAMSYPEPFLLYVGQDNGNLAALSAAGFTVAAHKAWFRWVAGSATSVQRKVVYFDLNPGAFPTDAGTVGPTEEDFMQEVAGIHIASRPAALAGLENYSYAVDRSTDPGPYKRLYDFMLSKKSTAWLNVQEARSQRVADPNPPTVRVWDSLADQWFNAGGHSVETTGNNPNTTYANRWPEGFEGFLPTITRQSTKAASNPGPTGGEG